MLYVTKYSKLRAVTCTRSVCDVENNMRIHRKICCRLVEKNGARLLICWSNSAKIYYVTMNNECNGWNKV